MVHADKEDKQHDIDIAGSASAHPENYPNGVSRWSGKAGTISVIREYLGLESGRARKQIRDVLQYVSNQRDAGATDIDAGDVRRV